MERRDNVAVEEPLSDNEQTETKQEPKVSYHKKTVWRTLANGELKGYTSVQKYVHKPKRTVYRGGKKPQPFKKLLRDVISSMYDHECEGIINYLKENKLGKYREEEENDEEAGEVEVDNGDEVEVDDGDD